MSSIIGIHNTVYRCAGEHPYVLAVKADNPDLYMQLTSGNFLTNSATVAGVVDGSSAPNVTSTPGKVGTAAAFNDTDARIQVPDYPEIRNATWTVSDFTVEAWVNWTSGGTANDCICSKGPTTFGVGSGAGWAFYINTATGTLSLWCQGGASPLTLTSTSSLTNGVDTHVAFSGTIDNPWSVGSFYIDGVADTANKTASEVATNTTDIGEDFNIGAYHPTVPGYDGWHNGWIQHVAVWGSVALSQAQIQAHFNRA